MDGKWDYLWESWLDKASWMAVIVCMAVMGVMFYTHHQEVKASGKVSSPAHAGEVRRRSNKVEALLKETKGLYKQKKYDETIKKAKQMLSLDAKEPFAYLYLARAYRAQDNLEQGIVNYSEAIKLHPDFVDRKSEDFLGRSKKELKPYVDKAIIYSKKKEFRSKPGYKKVLKHIYYLQRRMAGGCE